MRFAFLLHLPAAKLRQAYTSMRERSGSVVQCLTRDRRVRVGASTASLPCVLEPSLVLVQPRKTRPEVTERLLTEM